MRMFFWYMGMLCTTMRWNDSPGIMGKLKALRVILSMGLAYLRYGGGPAEDDDP